MTTFIHEGQDVQLRSNGTVETRTHYPASVHKGFPAPFQNIGNVNGRADKTVDDVTAAQQLVDFHSKRELLFQPRG